MFSCDDRYNWVKNTEHLKLLLCYILQIVSYISEYAGDGGVGGYQNPFFVKRLQFWPDSEEIGKCLNSKKNLWLWIFSSCQFFLYFSQPPVLSRLCAPYLGPSLIHIHSHTVDTHPMSFIGDMVSPVFGACNAGRHRSVRLRSVFFTCCLPRCFQRLTSAHDLSPWSISAMYEDDYDHSRK